MAEDGSNRSAADSEAVESQHLHSNGFGKAAKHHKRGHGNKDIGTPVAIEGVNPSRDGIFQVESGDRAGCASSLMVQVPGPVNGFPTPDATVGGDSGDGTEMSGLVDDSRGPAVTMGAPGSGPASIGGAALGFGQRVLSRGKAVWWRKRSRSG